MSLWKVVGLIGGACLAPLTGGTSLIASAALCGGIGLVAGHFLDLDQEKRNKENQELSLKGEVSKQIKDEVKALQEERAKEASNANNLDQQLAQKQNKLNDPNTPEAEKAQIRSEIAGLIAQKSASEQRIKDLDNRIQGLINSAQKTITGEKELFAINSQTKMMLVVAGTLVVIYWLNKDKDR